MPWLRRAEGALCFQDLRAAAFRRVLTVMKSLDLLAAKRADLQVLIGHGLTTKVSSSPGGVSLSSSPGGVSLTCLLQVLLWFEALRHVIISEHQRESADAENLTEAFYDLFMVRAAHRPRRSLRSNI